MLGMMFGLPALYAPAFAGPLMVLLGHWAHWMPPTSAVLVDLAISLAVAAAAGVAYRASLAPLGRLLQRRETVIAARVTAERE